MYIVVDQEVRIIVWVYKEPNGETLTPTDFMSGSANTLYPKDFSADWYSSRKLAERNFVVSGNAMQHRRFTINIKLGGLVTNFRSNSTTIEKNGIYIQMLSNQPTASDPPNVNFTSLYKFKDM